MWKGCSTKARTDAFAFSAALRAAFSALSASALIKLRLPAICHSIFRAKATISECFFTSVYGIGMHLLLLAVQEFRRHRSCVSRSRRNSRRGVASGRAFVRQIDPGKRRAEERVS